MLDERIKKAMKKFGLLELTPPQQKAIPEIIKGKHCLLIAPTGMGKTEAALLPVFHQFLNSPSREGIKILYITPLRALNRDMLHRTLQWGKELHIKIAVRHGDTPKHERRMQSIKPPDMLITTPETLQILLTGKRLRNALKNVRWLIVDEIHELASSERGIQFSIAMERLEELSKNFQRIGLSATIGNANEVAKFLSGGREVSVINVFMEKSMEIDVEYTDGIEEAIEKIESELKKHESTLIFVNTRDTAELLGAKLIERKNRIEVHHGSLSKEARIEAEEKFKNGIIKGLICTSSLELGIDIGRADYIIQFNSPRQVTRIVQRIGRSGHRIGRVAKGKIIACGSTEEYAESLIIAEKALKNEIEEIKIRKNNLAVLANQIAAIANEYGEINAQKVYEIVRRAYPFHALSRETFMKVVEELKRNRVIWLENEKIKKKKRATFYFIDNISMIPDEKSIDVIDVTTNKSIGKLDECFVTSYCSTGAKFIMAGRTWEIVSMDEKIKVAPSKASHIVPDWIGEEIPVPFEVAQEVGELRRTNKKNDIIKKEAEKMAGFFIPSDETLTIEKGRNLIVIVTHFGTRTNETFAKILGALLSQRYGGVEASSDAYRIYLQLPYAIDANVVKEILLGLKEETIEELLRIILKRSQFIKWELVKVARKFGAIEKDADYTAIRHLAEFFDEVIVNEAIESAIWNRMDIEHAKMVIRKLREGKVKIVIQMLSPISMEGEGKKKDFLRFGIDIEMLNALKKRLEEKKIVLKCMNCGHEMETRVYRAPLKCPKCGSKMLGIAKEKKMAKSASLIATYGRKALLVMAGYGIGADTAARILAKQKDGYELLREIMEAEITYSRTRRFWEI